MLSTINAGQLTKRGFLTLPDIVVVSGFYHLCIFKPEGRNAHKCSKTNRFYTIDIVLKSYFLLYLLPSSGLTDKASSYLLFRQANRICTRFSVRKISLHMSFKTRTLLT